MRYQTLRTLRACSNFVAIAIAATFCIAPASMAGDVGDVVIVFDDHNEWRSFCEKEVGTSELTETFDSFTVGLHPCPVSGIIAPISWMASTSSGQLEFKPTTNGITGLSACAPHAGESVEFEFLPPVQGVAVDFMSEDFRPLLLRVTLVNGTERFAYLSVANFVGFLSLGSPVVKIQVNDLNGGYNQPQPGVGLDSLYLAIATPGADSDGDSIADSSDNCPLIANRTQADCNHDGVGDVCEIAADAPDFNHDTVPDYCQCLADLVLADSQVNGADLGALLSQWGSATAITVSDINRDGRVDGADLGYLLSNWGPCPN